MDAGLPIRWRTGGAAGGVDGWASAGVRAGVPVGTAPIRCLRTGAAAGSVAAAVSAGAAAPVPIRCLRPGALAGAAAGAAAGVPAAGEPVCGADAVDAPAAGAAVTLSPVSAVPRAETRTPIRSFRTGASAAGAGVVAAAGLGATADWGASSDWDGSAVWDGSEVWDVSEDSRSDVAGAVGRVSATATRMPIRSLRIGRLVAVAGSAALPDAAGSGACLACGPWPAVRFPDAAASGGTIPGRGSSVPPTGSAERACRGRYPAIRVRRPGAPTGAAPPCNDPLSAEPFPIEPLSAEPVSAEPFSARLSWFLMLIRAFSSNRRHLHTRRLHPRAAARVSSAGRKSPR